MEIEYNKNEDLKFYPDGKGGQLGDRGYIGEAQVLEVFEDYILLDRKLDLGSYEYFIDIDRKKMIAVEHTGEHLFSGVAEKYFGLNNVGFRMGEDFTTVDLDSDEISKETIEALMKKINDSIASGAKVQKKIFSIEEAKKLSLRKPLSEKIKVGDVSVIEIEGFDFCACAGFHIDNIREVRLIKLISYEKIKNKCTRFYFVSGDRAIKDYNNKHEIITKLNQNFSCRDYEILSMVDKQAMELKNLKKSYVSLNQKYVSLLISSLLDDVININSNKFIILVDNLEILNEAKKYFNDRDETFIGIDEDMMIFSSKTLNCSELIKKIININKDLKGGGGPRQGNIKGSSSKEEIIEILNKILI